MNSTELYRTIWRWHFYARLFVIPLILILATTGAIYLFKPQLDRWEERAFQDLSEAHEVSANLQLDAAMKAFPGAIFQSYRLPERSGDAAVIRLALRDGHSMQDVFVSPQGKVLVCASAGAEARAKPAPSGMDRTRRFILFLLYGIVMDGDWLAAGTFRVFHSDQPIPAPIRAKVTARLAAGGNLSPPSKKSETKIFEPMNTSTAASAYLR